MRIRNVRFLEITISTCTTHSWMCKIFILSQISNEDQVCHYYHSICWIYNYRCNHCLSVSPRLTLWIRIPLTRGVLDKTLYEQVCQWIVAGLWFSPDTPVSSTNKTGRYNTITEILLKVALNTITLTSMYLV